MDTSHVNLLAVIGKDTPLKRAANTRGGEYAGACPWCGGRDRFRVWPHGDEPRYWCRQCRRNGDAIQYVRDRYGLTFKQACDLLYLLPELGGTVQGRKLDSAPRPSPVTAANTWPALSEPEWQAAAHKFVVQCTQSLFGKTGTQALAYLRGRGLHDDVIRAAKLGFNPTARHEQWGSTKVHLLPGIIIPWVEHSGFVPGSVHEVGRIWKVNIRRLDGGAPKYRAAEGSGNGLFGVSTLRAGDTVVLVEGEIDALSLRAAVPHLVTPLATGSVTGARYHRWFALLAVARQILVAFDADEPGETAAQWWLRAFPDTAVRLMPPRHDVNDMLTAGDDIAAWLNTVVPFFEAR